MGEDLGAETDKVTSASVAEKTLRHRSAALEMLEAPPPGIPEPNPNSP